MKGQESATKLKATVIPDWRSMFGHDQVREAWSEMIRADRLPPVVLLVGREGIGKRLLLAQLAALYLCRTTTACGQCEGCQWLLSDSHPEVLWIESAEGKLAIDDASRLQDHLSLSPGTGIKARIAVIVNVDQLNTQAANRLLKTLEEPPPRTAILMSTSRVHGMLPTVLSRCVRWRISPPPIEDSRRWLIMRAGDEGLTDLSPSAIDDALKYAGLAPGKAWEFLQGLENETQDLGQRISATLLEGIQGRPTSPGEALRMAEVLAKESGLSLGELTELYERSLNKTYWQLHGSDGYPLPHVWSVTERREQLRVLKRLSRRGRVPLNAQLAMEALAFTNRL